MGKQKLGSLSHKEMRKLAESFGWYYVRSKGDDDIFKHPTLKGIVTVTVGKTYSKSLVRSNLKYFQNGKQ
ncbi:type II toxin-antitoxin system HicA family toxin [Priestia megaterium]|uniref:type II toxin-antitoxin system HicA family toxin n=1 Tax=Priestia megaterium TaxID=1404 RepID=UPI000BFA7B4C|nr:type II toxin-antitoxin system HicA family toxin [Priestia megaterium]PFW43770.1 addiction module toxin, HicA family [Priestia megaterium]